MSKSVSSDIASLKLAAEGKKKIEWAGQNMPVMKLITQEFAVTKPLKGLTIGACLHVTSETANLVLAYLAGGAKVALCASNPLSTQDMVAASLVVDYNVPVFAIHGEDKKTYYKHLQQVLDFHPQLTTDDGADLVTLLHTDRKKQIPEVWGSAEETTTGVIRLKAMAKDGALQIPVLAVNDSDTKHLFDNRYGTGQSTVDGIIRTTNMLLAGKRVIICGYGWCSRGVATRMRGMGALVTVTEVDPVKALEAAMDGFFVDQIGRAVRYGDIFVTATGNKQVITVDHMKRMKDGAIVANSGHFNVEFDYDGLIKLAKKRRVLRNNLEEVTLPSGKRIFALGEGRLINLVGAEGHPAEVMDMSFANQALAAAWFVKRRGTLKPKVYVLPKAIDERVARLKLRAMGMRFDRITSVQRKYLRSWQEGT
ncbi:MAG: Adenosylhomocysteinase [Candidatus Gottesmanbacteria bacterium GW2011_GWB1_43_11]|uniref:Adenosylhomocysteinase n=1 Tax=Candidatus Gottesmanbacteria bacterium GW2011_GWB1_43_11 TaxID=1618446 RepID=A0A0G1EU82_9BACT|nr:MAG: Adenosylhomocysteinase [Candidatus Gottesmanbacteria bacterium GW2011_GWA2_42_16]KKS55352.1 MAG: Adenosylhomocysteinase [Candidatus Gottesmanbacteria bacterium GW2011_GWA1_42_26]KKS86596.1 MAG: Adenosylhomocysteinase [Candidatus Gottesmanbacteria bacterium GW2011_GWB1_43_11]OGG09187.1 MAG: adenosylhomocysteinase [Candidatus Gottesmanbacteria bacterium RIFCSPHIGHO2_01_FULL_43_15]OGG25386.1 MAG: adenosylhomocysteinase [Candidatus Gottesmanbacteria bacterium RIFCSPLOWO2_01_FULL_42_10]HCM3